MIETSRIESRCSRIVDALYATSADEVALLRNARVLKGIHANLKRAVWDHAKSGGWTAECARAEVALDVMEQDLRRVLLDYASLERPQLHDHLMDAVAQSFQALHLLEN